MIRVQNNVPRKQKIFAIYSVMFAHDYRISYSCTLQFFSFLEACCQVERAQGDMDMEEGGLANRHWGEIENAISIRPVQSN